MKEQAKDRRRRVKKPEAVKSEAPVVTPGKPKEPEVRRYFGSGAVMGGGKVACMFDRVTHTLDTDNPELWGLLDLNGFKWELAEGEPVKPETVDPLYNQQLKGSRV